MTPDPAAPVPVPVSASSTRVPQIALLIAVAIIPLHGLVLWKALGMGRHGDDMLGPFALLSGLQLVAAVVAAVTGIRARKRDTGRSWGLGVAGVIAAVLSVGGFVLGGVLLLLTSGGGAWGRPLRIRGRQLHPGLKEGADWTRGDRPDPSRLDEATRRALEALWLHDAQKEHASVPAFSRLSWLLAAVGAPAELMERSHRAALEEIDHTRRCFALAAGYAGRTHSVEAMPQLLKGGLGVEGDPLLTMATESLSDGCQLEDFNADVAAECATVCLEPTTRSVLRQIALEERSHADFSWSMLEWLLEKDRPRVSAAIEAGLAKLEKYRRPTAVSWGKAALVAKADPQQLLAHGRLPDERWGRLWDLRLVETRRRVRALLDVRAAA